MAAEPSLLAGGNPQIAKGEGDAPVQAWIATAPGWKRAAAERIDAVVSAAVPGARKAVKWNSPFYGVEPGLWFLSLHIFTRYVRVTLFQGTSLEPQPKGTSRSPAVRYFDIHEGEAFEEQLAEWVRQASSLPGEKL